MPRRLIPRDILVAFGGMLAIVAGVATVSRLQGTQTDVPPSTAVVERNFRFEDRPDGAINMLDEHNHVVRVLTGEAGFLRATLRGLAQQRLREDMGSAQPFRLTRWADGRLTLDDPATQRHIELEAFGVSNEAVFADLLDAGETKPSGTQP